ncbi:MAG: hypothetical protein JNK95_06990 [Candidatus Competibacter sp.]|nr:hypothetical protein [Candidatus Competibacter sp.]MDG4604552.1 hypothetical protein [Candidatus Contendobacter sp.]HRD48216.1 hypothetical protein [Candidatus Contendobacter sp.]
MKFKVTKIATAVAAGLGVSFAGMNAAQADALLFPYFAVSDTVTSIFTTINLADQDGTASAVKPQTLHYRWYYKRGANAENPGASCEEFDVRRVTSPFDVVTFDASGKYGDAQGVLAEPKERQQKAVYTTGQSFAMMKGLTPARGFLVVDNYDSPNAPFEGSLFGEIMLVDFAGGAVWGYSAYNAAPNTNLAGALLRYDFSDRNETAGEVIAGDPSMGADNLRPAGSLSAPVTTSIMPIASSSTAGYITTRFFVTPIAHNAVYDQELNPAAAPATDLTSVGYAPNVGQLQPNLTTRLWLSAVYTNTPNDVMYDRDENPVSGQTPITVTCVGAVDVQNLLSAGALREIGDFGGWTDVQVQAPGALANLTAVGTRVTAATRTLNSNQAVVTKLEYNPTGNFDTVKFGSAFNNALWLRYGNRESVRQANLANNGRSLASTGVNSPVNLRAQIFSAFDGRNYPVDVGDGFVGTSVSVAQ